MRRFSIAGLLGFVAVLAFGLAALVGATDAWVGAMFTLTVGVLLGSVLGVIVRGWRAGGWLGFALFGWGYFLLGNIPGMPFYLNQKRLPDLVCGWIFSKAYPSPIPPSIPPGPAGGIVAGGSTFTSDPPLTAEWTAYQIAHLLHAQRLQNAGPIAYWLSVLIFAEAGAILGLFLTREEKTVGAIPAPLGRAEQEVLATAPPDRVDCR